MNTENKRKCFVDPVHSKVINVNNLNLSRLKLNMKLELRALKKITEEVLHEGDNFVVVVPENVYENPSETVPTQSYEGIIGCYGSVTEEQLQGFFGNSSITPETPVIEKDISENFENKSVTANEIQDEPTIPTSGATSPDKSIDFNSVSCPDDDIELQNAIWHITPDFNLDSRAVPIEDVSYNDFLLEHSGDDSAGVLFDLS